MKYIVPVVAVIMLAAVGCRTQLDTSRFQLGPEDVVSASMTEVDSVYTVNVTLTEAASKRFTQLTEANLGKKLPLVVDGQVVSEPIVREVIPGPKLAIAGRGKDDAEQIVKALTK